MFGVISDPFDTKLLKQIFYNRDSWQDWGNRVRVNKPMRVCRADVEDYPQPNDLCCDPLESVEISSIHWQ